MFEQVILTLPKIGCQGCMKKVVTALGMVPSVEVIETSVPAKVVSLRYDDGETGMEQIEAALQEIGHSIGKREGNISS
jgi:copper chaperone CopZ